MPRIEQMGLQLIIPVGTRLTLKCSQQTTDYRHNLTEVESKDEVTVSDHRDIRRRKYFKRSPVALASWFLQNLMMATDPLAERTINGNLPETYDMQDFMDTTTISWSTTCITTSVRTYAELLAVYQDPLSVEILLTPTPVPFAAIKFRHELVYQPDQFLRDKYPGLVHSSTLDFGGHFPGYQEPGALATSIWTAVGKMELNHENSDGEFSISI